jgi:hypothetical protein
VEKTLEMQHTSIATNIGGLLMGILVLPINIIVQHKHEHIKEINVESSRSLFLSKAVAGEVKMLRPAPIFYYTSTKIIS